MRFVGSASRNAIKDVSAAATAAARAAAALAVAAAVARVAVSAEATYQRFTPLAQHIEATQTRGGST